MLKDLALAWAVVQDTDMAQIWHCCGVAVALLWLCLWPAAVALIGLLAWERPIRQKKKKKKKKEEGDNKWKQNIILKVDKNNEVICAVILIFLAVLYILGGYTAHILS